MPDRDQEEPAGTQDQECVPFGDVLPSDKIQDFAGVVTFPTNRVDLDLSEELQLLVAPTGPDNTPRRPARHEMWKNNTSPALFINPCGPAKIGSPQNQQDG